MSNLYITADVVGLESGGGKVTFHESQALKEMGPCEVWGREQLQDQHGVFEPEPWNFDVKASYDLDVRKGYKICHVYAGTFSSTIRKLKMMGCKVTYTAAAHDVQKSRQAHEELGVPYDYPHLTDPALWERYLGGYKAADVLICPSQHSAAVMRGFGCTNRIEVIPHGCSYVDKIHPLPERFTVGVLGAIGGPDKGLVYLLRAWKKLDYSDAVLVLGGSHSNTQWVHALLQHVGYPRNVVLTGWVDNVSDFYNSISLLVQPSITEGFGIEILEAMMHGRLALTSTGAGGVDVAVDSFPAADVVALASKIDSYKKDISALAKAGLRSRAVAEGLTWDKVRQKYVSLWRSMLNDGIP